MVSLISTEKPGHMRRVFLFCLSASIYAAAKIRLGRPIPDRRGFEYAAFRRPRENYSRRVHGSGDTDTESSPRSYLGILFIEIHIDQQATSASNPNFTPRFRHRRRPCPAAAARRNLGPLRAARGISSFLL